MSLRRGGTPLFSSGIPSIEASNQAQIDDLVKRNQALEQTKQQLIAQVATEVNRGKEAVQTIQTQHDLTQRQWKEGCEDLLASYRIVQKRLELELEKERTATVREMGVMREEKLQRLQRDFKIKLFQIKEQELDRKVEELEDEKTKMEDNYLSLVQGLEERVADYEIKLQEAEEAFSRSEKERKDKESKLNKLREKHANLDASNGTYSAKLERVQLQLEGAHTKHTELQRSYDELKRTNADITRQLEKWQKLETKEGAAAEGERKQRMALEEKLHELDEKYEKQGAELEKERKRVEKLVAWEVKAKAQETEFKELKADLAKEKRRNDRLKADLEIERARLRPPSPQKPRESSPAEEQEPDTIEVEEATPPPPPPSPPRKSRKGSVKPDSKPAPTVKAGLSKNATAADGGETSRKRQIARKTPGGRPPKKVQPVQETDGDDIEEILNPELDPDVEEEPQMEEEVMTRRKRKAKEKPAEVEDVEVEEVAPTKQKQNGQRKANKEGEEDSEDTAPATQKRKGKRKASAEEEEEAEAEEQHKAKRGAKAASTAPGTTRARSKPASRAPSRQPSRQPSKKPTPSQKVVTADVDEDGDDDSGIAPKKKKRRIINIFPTNDKAPMSFLGGGFGGNGIDIPTTLSPLKPDELVPQRSTAASSIVGSFSSLMNPFGRR